jgi:hypothetical protein
MVFMRPGSVVSVDRFFVKVFKLLRYLKRVLSLCTDLIRRRHSVRNSELSSTTLINMSLLVAFGFCVIGCALMSLAPLNRQAQFARIAKHKVKK